ncbi:MAG: carboxypeptidase-like regulatory domain-containing protein [Bacteroidia bacterium]
MIITRQNVLSQKNYWLWVGLFELLSPLQAQSTKVYQLSGMVLHSTTSEPIPSVRIRINHSRRGGIANEEGFYSLPVLIDDTLYFSALGYKPTRFILRTYLQSYTGDTTEGFIYAIQYMQEDTITLPEVRIIDIKTPEELKTALLNIPLEEYTRTASENVSPELIAYFLENLPPDPSERIKVAQQRYKDLYYQRNTRPMYPILDPIAVYRLVEYLSKKAKVKKEKVYDYWPD